MDIIRILVVILCLVAAVLGHIGYVCVQESDCKDTMPHSTCFDNAGEKTCQCVSGFKGDTGDTECIPILGGPCDSDVDCQQLNGSKCGDDETCECEATRVQDNYECKVKVGEVCSLDSECTTNATCIESHCACQQGLVSDGGKCATSGAALNGPGFLILMVIVALVEGMPTVVHEKKSDI